MSRDLILYHFKTMKFILIDSGTVIGSHGRTKCEVEFDDFDRQVVYVNNLIPTQGSTSRPKVKVSFNFLICKYTVKLQTVRNDKLSESYTF